MGRSFNVYCFNFINLCFHNMNKKNIILIFILFLLSFSSSYAYDEVLEYNFSWLWLINNWTYTLPLNLTDFTITQDSSAYITIEAFDCDTTWEFSIYINWTDFNISCLWWYDNVYHVEFWTVNLQSWTYQLFVDDGVSDGFQIWDINIYLDYNWVLTSNWYDVDYKKVWFFVDYDEFIEFAEETTIAYMIALIVVMIAFLWQGLFFSLE